MSWHAMCLTNNQLEWKGEERSGHKMVPRNIMRCKFAIVFCLSSFILLSINKIPRVGGTNGTLSIICSANVRHTTRDNNIWEIIIVVLHNNIMGIQVMFCTTIIIKTIRSEIIRYETIKCFVNDKSMHISVTKFCTYNDMYFS